MAHEHNVFTHFAKDAERPVCRACKTQRATCRTKVARQSDDLPEPLAFADRISAEHGILNEEDQSRDKDRVLLVIQGAFTKWVHSCPATSKRTDEVVMAWTKYVGPATQVSHAWTDNVRAFIIAFEELNILHITSTPHRSETKGVIERAVRRAKEGISNPLVQPGLYEEWWYLASQV